MRRQHHPLRFRQLGVRRANAVQRQFVEVDDRVSPQVVQIQTSQGLGSGIVYDSRGDIVTNAHVAGNPRRFLVTLAGGDRHAATLVGVPTLAALDPEFGDTPAAGIGFAIPSNTVRSVANRLFGSSQ